MARIQIPVSMLEFDEGGNTVWIHGPQGATVLRIKTMKKITVGKTDCENICSHSDILVQDGIEFCLAEDAEKG